MKIFFPWLFWSSMALSLNSGAQTPSAPHPHALAPQALIELQVALETEAGVMERALAGRFKLLVLPTDSPTYRSYVSTGLLRMDEATYERLETGLAALHMENGTLDGVVEPVCFLLLRGDRAGLVHRSFFQPLESQGGRGTGGSFLVAHETGHCLDQQDRLRGTRGTLSWPQQRAAELGIEPAAFGRVFGASVASGAIAVQGPALYADLGQRQYSERVADAFAALMLLRRGAPAAALEALKQARNSPAHAYSAHATVPILEKTLAPAVLAALSETQDAESIWRLARLLQTQVGVDASLGPHSTLPQLTQRAKITIGPKPFGVLPQFGRTPLNAKPAGNP